MKRVLSATLVGAVLASGGQAMAQSPSSVAATAPSRTILESAERMAVEATLEQDETFVRRRRSGALAAAGAVLAATGVVLALQPPRCSLEGEARVTRNFFESSFELNYEAVLKSGDCDLRMVASGDDFFGGWAFVEYQSDAHLTTNAVDFGDRSAVTNRSLNRVGLAAAGAGGVLLWFGLRQVEVPFRVDLGMGGRLSVSRSFGW